MCSCEIRSGVWLSDCVESGDCAAWPASFVARFFLTRVRVSAGFEAGLGLAVRIPAAAAVVVPLAEIFSDLDFDSTAFFSLSDFFSFGIRKYGLEFAQFGGSGVAGFRHLSQGGRSRRVTVDGAKMCVKTPASPRAHRGALAMGAPESSHVDS